MSASDKSAADGLPSGKEDELNTERAVEQHYRHHLRERATRPFQPDGSRSWWWTRTVRPKSTDSNGDDLVGRVALTKPNRDLGRGTEFYFGDSFAQIGGVDFYNWRNPLGRSFFDPEPPGPTIDDVAVVRTFEHRGRDLVDFVDDIVCNDPPIPYFSHFPLPPAANTSPPSQAGSSGPSEAPAHDSEFGPVEETQESPTQQNQSGSSAAGVDTEPFIRAETLLRKRLREPRRPNLASALSTLQPEQYRLVSAAASRSVIIEGGPGTGKSIIATHRAGYLIGDGAARESIFDGRLLVVGPTTGYTKHVEDIIYELTDDSPRVEIYSLAELEPLLPEAGAAIEFAPIMKIALANLSSKARMQLTSGRETPLTPAQMYEYIRGNGSSLRRLTDDHDWQTFLTSLPPYQQAKSDSRLTWFLGAIQRRFPVDETPPPIGHIIVDEAQDVTPTQWARLRRLNEGNAWTIHGDLNQRRTDHTFRTWSDVLEAVGLPSNTERIELTHGYRSTQPILEWANQLLPTTARAPIALQQDGPSPRIVETILEALPGTVSKEVTRLLEQYSAKAVAVISSKPGPIRKRLSEGDTTFDVVVMTTNEVRGLEFDAVIVVEPNDFPRNDRRRGPLYTALTRPNKELVIVHTKGVPPELERRQAAHVSPGPRTKSVSTIVAATVKNTDKNKARRPRRPKKRHRRQSPSATPPIAD
jgi:hypothetical protein